MFFKKKAVLFIHGFVGGIYDFGNLPREIQVIKKYDVFSYTLPGHDLSLVNGVKYTDWINSTEEQIKFLIKNGYKEIFLIGHSMGGVIASYLASSYKEVKKLVLAAPAFGYFSFKDGALDIRGFNNSIKNISTALSGYSKEMVMGRIMKTPINTSLEFTKLVNEYHDCIKRVNCDTLIIHGNDDFIVPIDAINYVYDNIGTNRCLLYNIKGINHNCFREKRYDEVNNIIVKFFKKKIKEKKKFNI